MIFIRRNIQIHQLTKNEVLQIIKKNVSQIFNLNEHSFLMQYRNFYIVGQVEYLLTPTITVTNIIPKSKLIHA